jgi:rare lipoprotein A
VNRRANTYVAVLLAVSGLTLAAPALVKAASGDTSPSGGVSVGGSGQSGVGGSPQNGAKPQVQPGNVTVTASGDGITVATRASAILRRPLRFSGNVGAGASGDTIEIERRGRETHWAWAPTTHGIASADGSFSAVWPTNHIGRFAIRALVERGQSAGAASASPTLTITVYRSSLATIYGPGFYGQRTACDERLRPGTLGVANRSLKCGTAVAIYYGGRTIVVPVIDRGPYAHNADWDVTEATARALGIEGTAAIGAVSLPGAGPR